MTPDAQGDESTRPTITSRDSGPQLAFINTWETADADAQRHLLAAMQLEAPAMMQKPGLLAMSFLVSADGKSLVVYALWNSQRAFDLGVTGDEAAIQARKDLARWGAPSARTYQVAAVYPTRIETSTSDNADECRNQPRRRGS